MEKNSRYDFEKETDKDFLKEAGKMLQEEVIRLRLEVLELKLQKSQDDEIKAKLTSELLLLRRRVFASKQEKKQKKDEIKKKKKQEKINQVHNQNPNKNSLDSKKEDIKLESQEVVHSVEKEECPGCKGELEELEGLFEESSEYDVNATYYLLKRHKRKKAKCKSCGKMVTAKGAEKLKPGALFSVQMAVQIACDKFQFHLPLERQRVKMKQAGLAVSVKTLFSLTEHLYQLLLPLEKMNKEDIITAPYACMDESPVNFYNPKLSKGHVWTLSNNIGAYYQFEASRSSEVAKEIISGYEGVVITDGWRSYGFLGEKEGVVHAYCWSHLRRMFFNAMLAEDTKAAEVVDLVDKLFKIEHEAQSFEELALLRKTRSAPVYASILSWVEKNEKHYLASTTNTGKAINYFYNQKEGLEKFLTHVHAPLSNNMAERRQRCPVMGRKNYLAFRTINGADVGMFFYSMIESCKTNGLNPNAYLQEMALRSIRGEELETPYLYACRLKQEIGERTQREIAVIA